MEELQANKSEISSLSIKELFYKYIRFLPLFILSIALALLVAYVYLRYATPSYSSNGSLIRKDPIAAGGDERFAQLFGVGQTVNLQNEIELLQSRQLMERVVLHKGLNFSYYAKGNIREINLYKETPFVVDALQINDSSSVFNIELEFPNSQHFFVNGIKKPVLFGQTFKTDNGIFRLIKDPYKSLNDFYRVEWRPTSLAASSFAGNVKVLPKGATGILLISEEAAHPELAADIVNQLIKEYQIVTIEDKNEILRNTIAFIDERLKGVSRELDSVTRSLLLYQVQNNLLDASAQSSSLFSKIENYDEQIKQQQVQISVAQMIATYLRDIAHTYDLVPSTLGITDATLAGLIASYNTVQLERKGLLDANIPASNARVQQKEDQLERLRKNILENLDNLIHSYNAAIQRLQQNTGEVKSKMQTLPEKQQELEEIRKQRDMKQSVFNLLMEKREESAISSAATISNIKVLEEAQPNKTPVSPNRRNVQLLAFVIGLAIPALFIFALEALNDKVTTRADIEKITAVPIVGEVGHSFSSEPLVVKSNTRGVVAEQFRIIRSNLQYILSRQEKTVLLITSSFSGEGKSFISTNMGAVMSLANKKTIVLEFDIRKPKVLSGLNMAKKPGLTNYLLGKIALEDLPIPVPGYDNFYVLACGPVPPNPAELLLDPKLNELFAYLKENFDAVIIDTAPVGMVSDAMTLSRFADATLYIVRQGHTFKKQIGLIDENYQLNKLPRISIILNDIKIRSGYGYYGYGRYGYGQGYGSGYFEDEATQPSLLQSWFGWMAINKWKKKQKRKKAIV